MENNTNNQNPEPINSVTDIQQLINNEIAQIHEKIDKKLQNPEKKIKTRTPKAKIIRISKKCIKCGAEKKIEEFRLQQKMADGHKSICILCDNAYQKSRYIKDKEIIKQKVLEWQKNNPDKVYQYKKDYKDQLKQNKIN
jgi:hypothetical protein